MTERRLSVCRAEETERTERACQNDTADEESKSVDRCSGVPVVVDRKVHRIAYAEESALECWRTVRFTHQ